MGRATAANQARSRQRCFGHRLHSAVYFYRRIVVKLWFRHLLRSNSQAVLYAQIAGLRPVEPFRPLIDHQIKKCINLSQIKQDDFLVQSNQYRLKWSQSPRYVKFLMSPIIERKAEIFEYVQSYYRCFMKETRAEDFPVYDMGAAK